MKYKKYDIVKVIEPFWEDQSSDSHLDKEAIITKVYGGYELTFLDGSGSSTWWYDNQLSFVREGNEDVVKAATIKYDEKIKMAQSWDWIKEHWKDDTISTTSMAFLMNEIGYHSDFELNGEYYILFADFITLYPIFNYLFEDKLNDALSVADKVFKPHYLEKVKQNIIKCYQEIWN